VESSEGGRNQMGDNSDRIVELKIKLMHIHEKISETKGKQTRYQQIEDLCYVNQSTNEESINNLNTYLGNLRKVLSELAESENKIRKEVQSTSQQYKYTIVKYKERKSRGRL
jgi:phage shock protein A